jgi:mono/diheme cytochrome c family protein
MNMNTHTTTNLPRLISAAITMGALALLAGGLAGCRGDRDDKPPHQFFPDMDDMPRWKAQTQSDFFPDHRTMRQPVPNTIAYSRVPMDAILSGAQQPDWSTPFVEQRDDLVKEGDAFYLGKNADGSFVDVMPVRVTKQLLQHGQAKFTIYCAVCHGYEGDGLGIVGDTTKDRPFSWSYALPNWHDAKYRMQDPADPASQKHKDGFLFNTARNGVVNPQGAMLMPPYKHALSERDAWAVVAYVRALQRSHLGTAGDLPDATRRAVDAATSTPGTSAPAGGKP